MTGRTVLIIDDDPDFARAIAHLFESEGDRVLIAANGDAGMETARTARPDVILLDVMMRERTEGFYTLDAIRRDRALRETPVIVLSSIYADYPFFKVTPDAGWLPADAFVAKPVDPAALVAETARVIAAREARLLARSAAP
jgi:CheY-like chemotaxis protein